MTRLDVLNRLASALRAQRYLEIGVQGGQVFRLVNVPHKVGVDPDPTSAATVKVTSDAYFAGLDPSVTFDLIFVDGLHLREQVARDATNALQHLSERGVVVFHDCDPPDERAGRRELCSGFWCGDTWRAWLNIRAALPGRTFTIDADLGLGVLVPPSSVMPDAPAFPSARLGQTVGEDISWAEFCAQRAALLGLVQPDAFRAWVRTLQPVR